ncbi:hypothetical protein, partial [Kistimonas scapharcae]|uniref:hypothetical protein n=1 Tax=Kistimonas scapharcae TaxID=1036133 RepID=UPI0031EB227D
IARITEPVDNLEREINALSETIKGIRNYQNQTSDALANIVSDTPRSEYRQAGDEIVKKGQSDSNPRSEYRGTVENYLKQLDEQISELNAEKSKKTQALAKAKQALDQETLKDLEADRETLLDAMTEMHKFIDGIGAVSQFKDNKEVKHVQGMLRDVSKSIRSIEARLKGKLLPSQIKQYDRNKFKDRDEIINSPDYDDSTPDITGNEGQAPTANFGQLSDQVNKERHYDEVTGERLNADP